MELFGIRGNQNGVVQITVSGIHINGGVFENIDDAIKKRKEMNIQYGCLQMLG